MAHCANMLCRAGRDQDQAAWQGREATVPCKVEEVPSLPSFC